MTIDADRAAEFFAAATDFTVGIEEEFALLDARTLDLVPRFEELRDAAAADDLLLSEGAQVMVETARLWMELGFFSERRGGRFCLNAVTGPDEYTTVVDNNAYTNLMAKENLEGAVRDVGVHVASRRVARHGSSRTVFREGISGEARGH